MIDSYSFGKIIINGDEFSSDVLIFKNFIKHNWWRKKGHELCIEDIKKAVEEFNPTIAIVGTGKFGLMKILPETEEYLRSTNTKLIVQKTNIAFTTYNDLFRSEKVLGAFHLTC